MNEASTTLYCLSCDKDVAGDPQTGRCLTCGHLCVSPRTKASVLAPVARTGNNGTSHRSPSAAYRPKPEALTPNPPRLELLVPEEQTIAQSEPEAPSTLPSSAWLAETRALQDSYTAAATAADEQARESVAEAKRLRKVADELGYLLELVATESETAS